MAGKSLSKILTGKMQNRDAEVYSGGSDLSMGYSDCGMAKPNSDIF